MSAARAPGRSAMTIRRRRYRPAAPRPCSIRRISITGSTLPPESTASTGSVPSTFPASTAARPTTPAGSTTIFCRSSRSSSARPISASVTVRTSSTRASAWASVRARGRLEGDAVGHGPHVRERHDLALLERRHHRGRPGRLHADDPDRGPNRLQCRGGPGDKTTPADRDQHRRDVGRLLGDLEADRALTGDDARIVEGRDPDGSGLRRMGERLGDAVVDHLVPEPDLGAVGPRRLHLGERGGQRHEDRRSPAEQGRGERDALRMVARRGRDHVDDVVGQRADQVIRATELEGAGALVVLGLQRHRPSAQLGEPGGTLDRGHPADTGQPSTSGFDLGQLHQPGRRARCGRRDVVNHGPRP